MPKSRWMVISASVKAAKPAVRNAAILARSRTAIPSDTTSAMSRPMSLAGHGFVSLWAACTNAKPSNQKSTNTAASIASVLNPYGRFCWAIAAPLPLQPSPREVDHPSEVDAGQGPGCSVADCLQVGEKRSIRIIDCRRRIKARGGPLHAIRRLAIVAIRDGGHQHAARCRDDGN